MSTANLQSTIDAAWEARDGVNAQTGGAVRDAVETALDMLDKGTARTAEKKGEEWVVNQWLKKAVLLSFRLNDMGMISGAPGGAALVGQGARRSSPAWAPMISRRPVSARFPAPSCAAAPTSRPTSC